MKRSQQESVAKNEAFFRNVNEAIARTATPLYAPDEPITFVCECGNAGCDKRITLARDAYEALRNDGSTFSVVPGHSIEGAETVLEQHTNYWVVRKIEHARAVAEATNPRAH